MMELIEMGFLYLKHGILIFNTFHITSLNKIHHVLCGGQGEGVHGEGGLRFVKNSNRLCTTHFTIAPAYKHLEL